VQPYIPNPSVEGLEKAVLTEFTASIPEVLFWLRERVELKRGF